MSQRNTSDLIEAHLKNILAETEMIEIRRTEMAALFNCVPSQINYVINTRFTIQRGYVVESKRGGGGYIRIEKIRLANCCQFLKQVDQVVEDGLSEREARAILNTLFEEKIISEREANLVLASMSKGALGRFIESNTIRAQMMHAVLERLSYEVKE